MNRKYIWDEIESFIKRNNATDYVSLFLITPIIKNEIFFELSFNRIIYKYVINLESCAVNYTNIEFLQFFDRIKWLKNRKKYNSFSDKLINYLKGIILWDYLRKV